MKLTRLIKTLKDKVSIKYSGDDFEVKAISCHSKKVSRGCLFVAVKGAKEDGSKFIDEAVENGASAVVTETSAAKKYAAQKNIPFLAVKDTRLALAYLAAGFYGNPAKTIKAVGITGTNGKTTISYLIESLLKKAGRNPAVIGTINYRFNDIVVDSNNTTPGPVELQSILARMDKGNVDYCLMEVSSHALDQQRTLGIDFRSAVFTNLTQDHLDYHKTMRDYFSAKAALFTNLLPEAFAVINFDDAYGRKLKKISRCKVVTYGIEKSACVMAKEIKFDLAHTEFVVSAGPRRLKCKTKLIGMHNVYNLLAAIGWAMEEGLELPLIQSAVEEFNPVPGRLEKIDFKGDFSVFVDYAHTDDALRNVLNTLRQVSPNRIIVVFGCGGERDKTKRPKMGRVVSELADYAVITDDNPRSEDPQEIIRDITQGIAGHNYCVIPDRSLAIKKSLSIAGSGDIVVIAGKGHENYQILKSGKIFFDDRLAARECLKQL